MTILPSVRWPIAVRGARGSSWSGVKSSFAWKTTLPSLTISGPPPIACSTDVQSGWRRSLTATEPPTVASAASFSTCVPRATSTAPPSGMATLPFWPTWTTTPGSSELSGSAGANGERTTSYEPSWAGVAGPHAGVYRETAFAVGGSLTPERVRRGPVPCQVEKSVMRPILSVPSASMPMLERSADGRCHKTPSCITMPVGWPSAELNRSPLMPPTVAAPETRFSIEVMVSRPGITPFARTGRRP